MPRIKWPSKKPKGEESKDKKAEQGYRSLEGNFRRLTEKELFLQVGARTLKFRLLAKTLFQGPKGEAVRDSLLQPGDLLSVSVNPEDEETARLVVLLRKATNEEKATATKPIDAAAVVSPTAADFGGGTAAEDKPAKGEPEHGERPAPAPPERTRSDPEGAPAGDPILEAAQESAVASASRLPDYLVEQVTTRSSSFNNEASWQTIDVVTAEVAVVKGKEEYRNVRINGRPADVAIEKTGAWSTGEFALTLEDVMSPVTAARFVKSSDDRVNGRIAYTYDYGVTAENSHWILVSEDRRTRHQTAYQGKIWIDKETRRILKIEQRAVQIPSNISQDKAETTVEYGFVRIDGGAYLLPVRGVTTGCRRGTVNCTMNQIEFKNYRRFSANSSITSDK